jgi:hypothetical protein
MGRLCRRVGSRSKITTPAKKGGGMVEKSGLFSRSNTTSPTRRSKRFAKLQPVFIMKDGHGLSHGRHDVGHLRHCRLDRRHYCISRLHRRPLQQRSIIRPFALSEVFSFHKNKQQETQWATEEVSRSRRESIDMMLFESSLKDVLKAV